jgi:hypothetical protein
VETGADPECCSASRAPRSVGMFDMNSGRSLRMPPGRKHIVDRVTLASDLIDEALRLHGDRITFHFDRQLQVPSPDALTGAGLGWAGGRQHHVLYEAHDQE